MGRQGMIRINIGRFGRSRSVALTWLVTAAAVGSPHLEAQASVPSQVASGALGLEQVVRAALGSNRDVIAARLGLREAIERVSEARGNIYPTVAVDAGYTRNVSPPVNFLPASIFDPTAGPDDYIGVQFGADNQWTSSVSV